MRAGNIKMHLQAAKMAQGVSLCGFGKAVSPKPGSRDLLTVSTVTRGEHCSRCSPAPGACGCLTRAPGARRWGDTPWSPLASEPVSSGPRVGVCRERLAHGRAGRLSGCPTSGVQCPTLVMQGPRDVACHGEPQTQ